MIEFITQVDFTALGEAVLAFLGGFVALGLTVAKLTKTKKDDEFFGSIDSLLGKIKNLFSKEK